MEQQNNTNQPSYGTMNSAQMINEKPKNHSYRMILVTVIVILLGIGGYIIATNPQLKEQVKMKLNLMQPTEEDITDIEDLSLLTSVITDRTSPWMEVKTPGPATATVGKPIEISVHGFSADKDIVGYDMLLGIDTEVFDIVSVTSKAPGFQIFDFDKGSFHPVTGIKDLQATESTVFNDTVLITVELLPKQAGKSVVTILSSKDQEKSQYVYEEGADVRSIVPQIGSVELEIAQ
ncbi:MAG: hypothetical protein O3B87_02445 [bacterium]|nr:hypothetical protein [bacterium]